MSTKAICEALDVVRTDKYPEVLSRARAEVEAIEREEERLHKQVADKNETIDALTKSLVEMTRMLEALRALLEGLAGTKTTEEKR